MEGLVEGVDGFLVTKRSVVLPTNGSVVTTIAHVNRNTAGAIVKINLDNASAREVQTSLQTKLICTSWYMRQTDGEVVTTQKDNLITLV